MASAAGRGSCGNGLAWWRSDSNVGPRPEQMRTVFMTAISPVRGRTAGVFCMALSNHIT